MVKTGAVAIFVQTPGFSPIKTRLAHDIGKPAAEEFYGLSVRATQAAVSAAVTRTEGLLTPYWALAEKNEAAQLAWEDFACVPQGHGGLGTRFARVYKELLKRHRFALLIGGDCPLMDPECLVKAASLAIEDKFVVGRSGEGGGFYLFGGSRPLDVDLWNSVPYGEPGAAETLIELVTPLGVVWEVEPSPNVDSGESLKRLVGAEFDREGLLAEQRRLLEWARGRLA